MELKIGDKAPEFEAEDEQGNLIRLKDFQGKKTVLYFYPKDNTPGCTAQACNLRDNYSSLLSEGYVVLGVSSDSTQKHKNFVKKYGLPFPLVVDTDLKVHELFGTWQEKKMYGKSFMGTVRTTFIIDEQGNISNIIRKVKTKEHARQILRA